MSTKSIRKRDKFWGGLEKQTALKLRWRRAADCSRGGIRPPEMHDHQQWTVAYVGSLSARMTTTGDGDGWKRRRSGCSRKDTVAPGRAGIGRRAQLTWNRCVPETAASVGLAALVFRCLSVSLSVCLSVMRLDSASMCKSGWTDQDPVWVDHCWGLKEHRVIRGSWGSCSGQKW